nr:putative baseplate assembly protein [Pseudomonas sp.]
MTRQFRPDNPRRLQLLRDLDPPVLNGIDYLEVTSKDQRSLKVVFVHPPAGLTLAHCRIEGGVRVRDPRIVSLSVAGNSLELQVEQAGDFSWYQFSLVEPAAPEQVPDGFDPVLSSIRFSFKAQCPSEFDCASSPACPSSPVPEPLLDYLAKDYGSFRRLMLDRMGQLIAGFHERNPADFSVALVEMLAHIGDQLSYYQDAVATEAYLGTARRRISLRRHARLLDYAIHDGCNSRAYLTLGVRGGATGKVLPPGSRVLSRGPLPVSVEPADILDTLPDGNTEVFETLHALPLHEAHSEIAIHDWGAGDFSLEMGATTAALVSNPALALEKGMVLIFEEVRSSLTGRDIDADPSRRHAVRLVDIETSSDPLTQTPLQQVRWHAEDALPFRLHVSARFAQGGGFEVRQLAVACGNVVLADHGLRRPWEPLLPDMAPDKGDYRPRLREAELTHAEPYRHEQALAENWSAARSLRQDPRQALPAGLELRLRDPMVFAPQPLADAPAWQPRRDLLGSDRHAHEFVVESEDDGTSWLRFGDAHNGRQPEPGLQLLATYRLGGGSRGNVGPDSLTRLVCDDPGIAPFIWRVRNPLPAQGGADPESPDAIKLLAPEAFQRQERAVTEDDYARVAERHPEVQRAAARLRWTGSWYTVFISLDRKGGLPLDAAFRVDMLRHLERFRLAGYDLELSDPVYVPLDIALDLCILPGHFPADVSQAVLARLGSGRDQRGRSGFFHPDFYSFGDGLALSRLLATVHDVPGVASVDVLRFQRWGKTANHEIEHGRIDAAPLEVLRLDNDPNFPENGRLVVTVKKARP